MTIYFEDFEPGRTWELGSYTFTEESIIEFARQYDPQYFHTDPVKAKESVFGGLVASGWQTLGIYMYANGVGSSHYNVGATIGVLMMVGLLAVIVVYIRQLLAIGDAR